MARCRVALHGFASCRATYCYIICHTGVRNCDLLRMPDEHICHMVSTKILLHMSCVALHHSHSRPHPCQLCYGLLRDVTTMPVASHDPTLCCTVLGCSVSCLVLLLEDHLDVAGAVHVRADAAVGAVGAAAALLRGVHLRGAARSPPPYTVAVRFPAAVPSPFYVPPSCISLRGVET